MRRTQISPPPRIEWYGDVPQRGLFGDFLANEEIPRQRRMTVANSALRRTDLVFQDMTQEDILDALKWRELFPIAGQIGVFLENPYFSLSVRLHFAEFVSGQLTNNIYTKADIGQATAWLEITREQAC